MSGLPVQLVWTVERNVIMEKVPMGKLGGLSELLELEAVPVGVASMLSPDEVGDACALDVFAIGDASALAFGQ